MGGKIIHSIRTNLFVGLILITPIVVTVLVGNWIFHFITDVAFLFFPKGLRESHPMIFSRVTALVAVLFLLFVIGLLARNYVGRKLYQFGDAILRRVPVLNKIYLSVRQISEALLAQRQQLFKEVVLVQFPHTGMRALGFTTASVPESFAAQFGEFGKQPLLAVFIPTAPNPTSGFVVYVPQNAVTVLGVSVAEAMKLVVSGGAVFPGPASADDRSELLDKLEEWMRADSPDAGPAASAPSPAKRKPS